MSRELLAHNRPVFDQLHPNVYRAAAALVVLFIASAWFFFDRGGNVELPLIFVTVLFIVALSLPWLLFQVWKKYGMSDAERDQNLPFHDWKAGDFAVWGSRLHGSNAAVDVLLPFMAMGFGLVAIGIVFAVVSATV